MAFSNGIQSFPYYFICISWYSFKKYNTGEDLAPNQLSDGGVSKEESAYRPGNMFNSSKVKIATQFQKLYSKTIEMRSF